MRLAYVTTYDSSDVRAWSGLGYYILRALRASGLQVDAIGNLADRDTIAWIKGALYGRVFNKTYIRDWEPSLRRSYAAQVHHRLRAVDYDAVVSPGPLPVANLQIKRPIVFWHDATFAGLVGLYFDERSISADSLRNGHKIDQLALSKCRLAIYSSEWAARTAIENYAVDPAKVKVVPFGANVDCDRDVRSIQALIDARDVGVCRLLFVGVDWLRKGGDIALQAAGQLNRRGIPTELHVVGCEPPGELPGFVRRHGFISKTTEQGRQELDSLFSRSHFFILPTRADCTPVVFPEACSFGLPILTSNVGGIPTVVLNGKNGFAYPPDAGPDRYCDTIERLWSSRQDYEQLALSSFDEYSQRLNWESAGRAVAALIQGFCG